MRFSRSSISILLSVAALLFSHSVVAIREIGSKSLATCMENSGIFATTFAVSFTPDNNSFAFNVDGTSTVSGNVTGNHQSPHFRSLLNTCLTSD
jgi:ML-like domain